MKLLLTIVAMLVSIAASAQQITAKWELSDKDNLSAAVITGDEACTALVSTAYAQGSAISKVDALTGSNASEGFTSVTYSPKFAAFYVDTKKTAKTAYHNVAFSVKPQTGHKFKPVKVSFDPAIKYAGNPNKAVQEDLDDPTGIVEVNNAETRPDMNAIYTLQGIRVMNLDKPGFYIMNGKKMYFSK